MHLIEFGLPPTSKRPPLAGSLKERDQVHTNRKRFASARSLSALILGEGICKEGRKLYDHCSYLVAIGEAYPVGWVPGTGSVRLRYAPGVARRRSLSVDGVPVGYAATAVGMDVVASWLAFQAQGIISPSDVRDGRQLGEDVGGQARGSTSLSLQVYADRRTMPNGSGGNPSLGRNCEAPSGLRLCAIRHSLAIYSAFRKASRRSLGRKRVGFPCLYGLSFARATSFSARWA